MLSRHFKVIQSNVPEFAIKNRVESVLFKFKYHSKFHLTELTLEALQQQQPITMEIKKF